jgi:GNAT superfamily N-acetyltransferase
LGAQGQLEVKLADVDLTIRAVALDSAEARELVGALDAELSGRYPEEGATHFRLDAEEVASGRGAFLVAAIDGSLVACGAVRCIEPGVAEIKRMYVSPAARGRGIARVLLEHLEREARALGAHRIVLETGVRQPEALALYRRAGYEPIEPWGEYVDSPLSLCMGKKLERSA